MATTLEEKQKELDALQTAFDDYIASSRELEEELDAELTRCRKFFDHVDAIAHRFNRTSFIAQQ